MQNSLRPFIKSWFFPWLFVGLALRVLLSMFTQHPDIWGLSLTPTFFSYQGVINIYDHLWSLTTETSEFARTLGTRDVFIYPPLVYFTLGAFSLLLRPFQDAQFVALVMSTLEKTLGDPELFRYLLLAKLPYFVFDFGALVFISKLFQNNLTKQRWAMILWLFNPLTIYATYMVGNFDIIPIFFTVVGTYCFFKKQYDFGFLFFGIAAGYKTYPILAGLPLVLFFGKSLLYRARYFFLLISPYAFTSLLFITSPAYRLDVLFNPKNTKFLFMFLQVSGPEVIFIFILIVVFLLYHAALRKLPHDQFWLYPFVVLLALFSVTHYHPQWMSWIAPFGVLAYITYRSIRWPLLIMVGCYAAIVLLFEPSLNISLIGPVYPPAHDFPSIADTINTRYDVFQLKSIFRSIFAASAIWITCQLFTTKAAADHHE